MRYLSAHLPPIHSTPPPRLWQRLVMALLGMALVAAMAIGAILYLYFKLTARPASERVLTTRGGDSMQVKIQGRTADTVKVTTLSDGLTHFYPIADLSADDQAAVNQMPVSMAVQYPFLCTLTNRQTRVLAVMILGRTAEVVTFIRMSDHKTYAYAISKLSAVDQDFVRSLPLSEPVSVAAALPSQPAAKKAPATPADSKTGKLVANMQDMIASMILGSPSPSATETPTTDGSLPSIFEPLPGIDGPPQAVATTSATTGTASAESQIEHVTQVYQQIANVTTSLETTLSKTNPMDEAAVEQQLLAAQSQLEKIYQQENAAAGKSGAN